jgi:hypothetical protein
MLAKHIIHSNRSALFVKSWRVKVIADNPMQRVVLKDKVLLCLMGVALGMSFVILACWQLLDPRGAKQINCSTDWSEDSVTTTTCDLVCSQNAIFPTVQFSFQFVMLLLGLRIAMQIWLVHDAFSESRLLIFAIYTQSFTRVYAFSVDKIFSLSSQDYPTYVMMFAYIQWLSYTFTINLILLPKFWAIVRGDKVSLADIARTMHDPLREPLHRLPSRRVRSDSADTQSRSDDASPPAGRIWDAEASRSSSEDIDEPIRASGLRKSHT